MDDDSSAPRVAVVGVGLIGGSIGLAARERLGAAIDGYDTDPAVLSLAQRRGAIDAGHVDLRSCVEQADAVFVAAPVGALPELVGEVLAHVRADCVVTDAGSTKRLVVGAHDDQRFVGGHPLAGAETSGVEHARADLFEDATWYLTPTGTTSGVLFERLHRMLVGFGARPSAIDPADHDRLMAGVSHLPHVLANVLVDQVAGTLRQGEEMPATGPSFRDATRVAGANSSIWTDIYLSNRDALLESIDDALERLRAVRAALNSSDADALAAWNDAAAGHRQELLDVGLAGGEVRELRASVPNRPGVIADIALALGRESINIVDLALSPSADNSRGLVAIWVRGDDGAQRALRVIGELGIAVTAA